MTLLATRDAPGRGGLETALGLSVFVGVVAALLARIRFGIDLTDESFFAAMPYGFARGARPFHDELIVHQTASILVWPFVSLYVAIEGSADGLAAFLRHLWLASALLASLVTAIFFVRRGARRPVALVAGALVGSFVPYHLPYPCYNTIGSHAFLAGCLLVALACTEGRPAAALVAGTLAHALAAFAYPPLVIASVLSLAGGAFVVARRKTAEGRRALRLAALTGVASAVAVGLLLVAVGRVDLERVLAFTRALHSPRNKQDPAAIAADFAVTGHAAILVLAMGAFVVFAPRVLGRFWIAGALVLALAGLLIRAEENRIAWRFHGSLVLTVLPILALPALPYADAALRVAWVSGLAAGLTTTLASTNGAQGACIGLVPAGLVGLLLVRSWVGADGATRSSRDRLLLVFASVLVAVQARSAWDWVYRDADVGDLVATVETGPWRGLRTTVERRRFIEELAEDVAKTRGNARTLLAFDDCPCVYLVSDLVPAGPTVWVVSDPLGEGAHRRLLASEIDTPDLVVHFRPSRPYVGRDEILDALVGRGYRVVLTRPGYEILRRPA